MGQSDEGYDVATYISARHRQFLDLSRDMGILVLNRPSDSTLPEDVVQTGADGDLSLSKSLAVAASQAG